MQMPFEQLVILAHEAVRHQKQEREDRIAVIKNVADSAHEYLKSEFHLLRAFSDLELFKKVEQKRKMEEYEAELPPEEVKKEFENLAEMGLDELEVEMPEQPPEEVVPLAEEIVSALGATGFEEFSASFLTAQADLTDIDLEEE